MRASLVLASLAATLAGGCNHLKCGDGTFANGDECVAYDPNDKTPPVTTITPAGGRSRSPLPDSVMLSTDEQARIYVSTDGSEPDTSTPGQLDQATIVDITQGMTIKFFAIDLAGNREATQSATFDSDTTPPGVVTGMQVAVTGTSAHVTWTNPTDADFAGVVFARVADVIDGTPTPGATYAPGPLTGSVQILSVGTTTSFDDAGRPPGPVRYVAWAFDDLGNYSAPVAATGQVALGSLTAQLTYNTGTQTLTIVQAPANLDIAGSTATYAGTTVTLSLAVKNNTVQYFQNPKAEVTSVASGSFTGADGTADGSPFKTLGPNALAPGATATATLTFTVAAATTATINLTFAQHPTLLATASQVFQFGMIDMGTGASLPVIPLTTKGPNDRIGGRIRPPVLTGGHYVDVPSTHGAIERFDLVTRTKVGAASLDVGDRCNIQALISTGADMIALVKFAGRRRAGTIGLYRIDEGLHVTAQVQLPISDDRGYAFPALAPDGTTLAVVLANTIVMVDARTLAPIDQDPSTPELDTVDPGFTGRIRTVVFFHQNNMVVLSRSGGQAAILDQVSPGVYTRTLYQDANTTAKGFSAATAPDGKIWMAFSSGLRAFDPTNETVANISYAPAPQGLSMVNGQLWVIESDRLHLDQVSTTGTIQRTIVSANAVYGHWLSVGR